MIVRVLLRPHRDPPSRIAWVLVIAALPVVGIISYLLFGEVNIGRTSISRGRAALQRMPRVQDAPGSDGPALQPAVPERHQHLCEVGRSISGFAPVGGNPARLLADSSATIDTMVADIDAAAGHVHRLLYIWLPDNNGCRFVDALIRAAGRGVT